MCFGRTLQLLRFFYLIISLTGPKVELAVGNHNCRVWDTQQRIHRPDTSDVGVLHIIMYIHAFTCPHSHMFILFKYAYTVVSTVQRIVLWVSKSWIMFIPYHGAVMGSLFFFVIFFAFTVVYFYFFYQLIMFFNYLNHCSWL